MWEQTDVQESCPDPVEYMWKGPKAVTAVKKQTAVQCLKKNLISSSFKCEDKDMTYTIYEE